MEIIKKIVGSKKFWYAFASICLLCFSNVDSQSVVLITLGLLISQGLADRTCKK